MSPFPGAPSPAQQALNPENPFPGLLPFEERDAVFFFGRDAEKADLFERVRRETLTVVFGRSGLGKTSLLRAGVFPMLREAGLLPIPVRLDFSERGRALGPQVQAAIVEVIEAQAVEAQASGAGQSLWEYFHTTHFWGAGNRLLTPVLVMDQFEELFTLGEGDDRIGPFITELADLIENYIPASVRARIEASGEPLAFGYEQQNYRVVVSLREDYLPDLEAVRGPIPALGRNRVRLAHLDGRNALEAIVKPAPDLVSREVGAYIVRYVAGETGAEHEAERGIDAMEIDPAILSLVCRELNERRRTAGLPMITTELLAGAREDILPEFYEQGLRDLPKAVRELVEDRLITGSGHRRAEALDDVLRVTGVTEEAISRLVDRRLLRREERLGVACIELTHDVLTGVVRESRDARQAAELRRKRRRRALIAGTAVGALASVAIALAAVFANLYYRAEEQETLARKHPDKAESLINFMLFDLRDRLIPLGRLDILEPAAKRALEYFDQRAASDVRPERTAALNNIGDVWRDQGKRQAALDAYEKALAIAERLAAQDPGNAGWQRDVSVSYNKIGDVRRDGGDRKGALAVYENALALAERLAAQYPGNAGWQRDVSMSYERIGNVRGDEGDRKGALAAYEKSLAIAERLAAQDPGNAGWQWNLAVSYARIGGIRRAQGERETARNAYGKAFGIYERLAARDPGNATYEWASSLIYLAFAELSKTEGHFGDAMEAAQKAIRILEKLIGENRLDAPWRDNLPLAYGNLAWYALFDGKPREAITAASRGIELGPALTWIKTNLAHGYLFVGDYDKAEDIYLENKDTRILGGRSFRGHVLDDFRQFRAKGLSHSDMARIERLLQAPAAP